MKHVSTLIRILFLGLFLFLLVNGKVMLWLALFAASLVLALFFGRIYCGYGCPMNTLMGPVEWLSKKLGWQTAKAPAWLGKGYFTWISLAVSVAVMVLSRRFLQVELPVLPFWLVMSVLVTLRYKPEVFHNLICPFGALQRTFGRFARKSETVSPDVCVGCKLCEKACPSAAISVSGETRKAKIQPSLCHQCAACSRVCPKQAIAYRGRAHSA